VSIDIEWTSRGGNTMAVKKKTAKKTTKKAAKKTAKKKAKR
jgi:hypothetical protein